MIMLDSGGAWLLWILLGVFFVVFVIKMIWHMVKGMWNILP